MYPPRSCKLRSPSKRTCRKTSSLLKRLPASWLAFLCIGWFVLGIFTGQFSSVLWFLRRLSDTAARSGRYYAGRTDVLAPSPKCCFSEDCLTTDKGRHAIITSLRTNKYLPLVQELACSLSKTNPHIPFYVYTVKGDLSPHVEEAVRAVAELRYWPADLRFPSKQKDGRYELNWVKLRTWELVEFDGVLVLDSDVTVLGDLSFVFKLPTPFAAVPDQDEVPTLQIWFASLGRIQGGFFFVRPCQAVAEHMQALVARDRLLQYEYEYAEQGFLDWYFRFDRWLLPLEYNSVVPITRGNTTQAGVTARVIHFTKNKPFYRDVTVPHHRFLTCTSAQRPAEVELQHHSWHSYKYVSKYVSRRWGAWSPRLYRGRGPGQGGAIAAVGGGKEVVVESGEGSGRQVHVTVTVGGAGIEGNAVEVPALSPAGG